MAYVFFPPGHREDASAPSVLFFHGGMWVKRPWHKIPQALSHPHAAVKKQHGGRGSALSMARRKKDVGHQLLTV